MDLDSAVRIASIRDVDEGVVTARIMKPASSEKDEKVWLWPDHHDIKTFTINSIRKVLKEPAVLQETDSGSNFEHHSSDDQIYSRYIHGGKRQLFFLSLRVSLVTPW